MNTRLAFIAGVLTGATASALLFLALRAPEAPRAVGADAMQAARAPSMEQATTRLEARLERNGGTAADWELLAKSYEFLGQPEAAARARQHTNAAGAPARPIVAEKSNDLSDSMPSAAAVAKLTVMDETTASMSTGGGQVTVAEISGTVTIDHSLASRVDRDAVLFIYAKAADAPGPPLAVLRLSASSWPVSFRLDDSLAMLPSRRLSQFQKVVVEARISRSGQATAAPGDLYVTSNAVTPSSGKKLALVINHEIG